MTQPDDKLRVAMLVATLQEEFKDFTPEEIRHMDKTDGDDGLNLLLQHIVKEKGYEFFRDLIQDLESWVTALQEFERITYNRIRANKRKSKKV